ncbi:sensor histidine kinase [Dokdonia sp.]|uniref:sensor histidine kinase n=1 Tax=Dokdonia sp. TaxID=2024995 RepID=UPI0032652BF1
MREEENQIIFIFVVSAAFVVLLAILLVLFLVIYQKRIVTQENRLQKLENEKQQSLLKATIEGQERERKRLAKDLHDSIGSLLSGLSFNLKFQKNLKNQDQQQLVFLEEACKLVDEGIENIRIVSHNLIPSTLENFGLVSAIKECIVPLIQTNNLEINIQTSEEFPPLPLEISLGILRVFQELVQNTIKHAYASKIEVLLICTPDTISLEYTDNGKGFHINDIDLYGIGIKNMQSRIQALHGTFFIDSKVKKGFRAYLEVPIILKEDTHGQTH